MGDGLQPDLLQALFFSSHSGLKPPDDVMRHASDAFIGTLQTAYETVEVLHPEEISAIF